MQDSIKEIASRWKRNSRNPELIALCDYVLEGGAGRSASGPENRAVVMNHEGSAPSPSAKFDRNSYQRTYMRDWRARKRREKVSALSS